MKTHIVTETEAQSWVLRPIAENLAAHMENTTVGTKPDPGADVNLFVNYALWTEVDTIRTALFTHKEEGRLGELWEQVDREAHWRFVMNRKSLALITGPTAGVLQVWPDPRFMLERPYVLGVCSRDYASGRKRTGIAMQLSAIPGIEIRVTGGNIEADDMPAWYDGIDALVVLSDNEGGPLPVIEAFARHKPVIAPDVGFCWEWPVLRYRDTNELMLICRGLARAKSPTSWERTARYVQSIHWRLTTWMM